MGLESLLFLFLGGVLAGFSVLLFVEFETEFVGDLEVFCRALYVIAVAFGGFSFFRVFLEERRKEEVDVFLEGFLTI